MITDRNDLDNQLFATFSAACELLRQTPEQAADRKDLQDRLNRRVAGGVIFATIQKFMPEKGERYPALCKRSNVVVIADEAHRSQYGFLAHLDEQRKTMAYGFAQHLRDALPKAGFIGFTGTPVELDDRDTRAVFGDYVDIYDIQQAVDDGATVPIYYENRQAKLILDETARLQLDEQFDEVTEDEEDDRRERLKRKWAALETLLGSEARLTQIAQDLIQHFEERQRFAKGKGMIVCMSREICVRLYAILVHLRPAWHNEDPDKYTVIQQAELLSAQWVID